MITASRAKPTRQQERRDHAAEQRSHGGGDGRRGAHRGVDLHAGGALEVAVDERLHRRQQQRRTEAADDRPEHDDRDQVLRQRHGDRPDGVAQESEDVGALAAEEVADLAADQDEGR